MIPRIDTQHIITVFLSSVTSDRPNSNFVPFATARVACRACGWVAWLQRLVRPVPCQRVARQHVEAGEVVMAQGQDESGRGREVEEVQ